MATTILNYPGHLGLWKELEGSDVHSLKNILTLDLHWHTMFDELQLGFEPTVRFVPLHVRPGRVSTRRWLFSSLTGNPRYVYKLRPIITTGHYGTASPIKATPSLRQSPSRLPNLRWNHYPPRHTCTCTPHAVG